MRELTLRITADYLLDGKYAGTSRMEPNGDTTHCEDEGLAEEERIRLAVMRNSFKRCISAPYIARRNAENGTICLGPEVGP